MNISFFTDILNLICWVFIHFQPLLWIFAMAIICSIAYAIKYVIGVGGLR